MSNQAYLQPNDRRWACPGLYRIPPSADGGICRIKLAHGCLTLQQMHILADAAEKYGNSSVELTTRANIQIRGVNGNSKQKLIDALIAAGLGPLTKAGDDIRNIMINPTAGFDHNGNPFVTHFAENLSHRLQSSPDYQSLSPKFSFYIDGGEDCAVLDHVSDIWLSITEDRKSFAFGVASCPPTAENDIPSLGIVPLARGTEVIDSLLGFLLAARRQDHSIQRMKHLVSVWGYGQIYACLRQKMPDMSSAPSFQRKSLPGRLDLGIHATCFFQRYYLGVKPPLGRLKPHMMHNIAAAAARVLSSPLVRVTPWQGLIFPDCTFDEAETLAAALGHMGLISDSADAYASILCCSGLPGCAAALTDTQTDAHKLTHALQGSTFPPVHLIACSKSCTATQPKPVTLLAVEPGCYDMYYKDKRPDSKFGRLAASKVTINDVAMILSTDSGRSGLQKQ